VDLRDRNRRCDIRHVHNVLVEWPQHKLPPHENEEKVGASLDNIALYFHQRLGHNAVFSLLHSHDCRR
jgi:hypothetical protein